MINWKDEKSLVLLKFLRGNGSRRVRNPVISKTMGRTAVISHSYDGEIPAIGSFWLCEIEREFGEGTMNGCFVVKPIKQIPITNIVKLVPGAYDTEVRGQTVICKPKIDDLNWIIPSTLKRYFISAEFAQVQYQSVVVPLKFSAAQSQT